MTPAIASLEAAGVAFTVHEYHHQPGGRDFGREAADALGVHPDRVFKTLLVADGEIVAVAIVPVSAQLSLKAAGRALGLKRLAMCEPERARRVTGYVLGGISPFGQRRRLPTVVDETGQLYDEIYVSGGRRGVDVGVAPADLIRLLDATTADITA